MLYVLEPIQLFVWVSQLEESKPKRGVVINQASSLRQGLSLSVSLLLNAPYWLQMSGQEVP